MEFTKGKIPLLGSALDESAVKRLESVNDDYSVPSTNTSTKETNYYLDIMCHKAALCKHVTLYTYIQVWVKVVTEYFASFNRSPKIACEQDVSSAQPMGAMK